MANYRGNGGLLMKFATYMDIVMAMIFRLGIYSFAPVSGYWAKALTALAPWGRMS